MFGWGGSANNVNAQLEADRLARLATENPPEVEDQAGERAEQMTNAVRAAVGSIIVAAITVGAAWVLSGTTAAVVVAGVAGVAAIATIAVIVRRRSRKPGVEG